MEKLTTLLDRFVKLLAILATLSLRIIELADARTRCSLRARVVIPGNGMISEVQTSASRCSILILSTREGARTGIRFVVRSDWDLLIELGAVDSLHALVFLMITWKRPVIDPTVVALWIDSLLAVVPTSRQLADNWEVIYTDDLPGFPKTDPRALISKDSHVLTACSPVLKSSFPDRSVRRSRHSSSSLGEQALIVTSNSWWSHSNTSFHENSAVWHWSPEICQQWYWQYKSWLTIPFPLSISSTLSSLNPIQAWTVYTCSTLEVDASSMKLR